MEKGQKTPRFTVAAILGAVQKHYRNRGFSTCLERGAVAHFAVPLEHQHNFAPNWGKKTITLHV